MDEKSFIYWLQGYLELSGAKTLDESQVQQIRDHMSLILKKVTPSLSGSIVVGGSGTATTADLRECILDIQPSPSMIGGGYKLC